MRGRKMQNNGGDPGRARLRRAAVAVAIAVLGGPARGGTLQVLSVDPPARGLTAAVTSPITIEFDRPLATETVTGASFWAFARWSGAAEGVISFAQGNRRARLTPDHRFSAGEQVMVILARTIRAADGSPLREGGYAYQFWTRAAGGTLTFEQIGVMSTRSSPEEPSTAYGGIASDLDGDRFLDVTIVNETTADLRVFLNRADGSGTFDGFLRPTFPVGDRASPSEPSDFNRDGRTDICVANINDGTVSVLLGNGDGTFAPQQLVPVGGDPRGITVLDADGDGDVDIANTNAGSSSMSIMLNDGTGVFGPAQFFEAGVTGEWALAAADMNEDGMLDLVVGGRNGQRVIVDRGNGDGTFTPVQAVPSGGATWMLVVGDVNGDGHEDVALVNSSSDNGAILLGDGTGHLGAPQTLPTDPFPLATDLGDLDGDGDLDWVTSSFGGDWFVFRNDGDGSYAFDQEILSSAAASCALPFDLDNDGDLDLGLVDERDDLLTLMRNAGTPCPGDLDGSGAVDFGDILAILSAWGNAGGREDLDGSGVVDFGDILVVLSSWGPC